MIGFRSSVITRGDCDFVEGAIHFELGGEESPWITITDRIRYVFPDGTEWDRVSMANAAFSGRLVASPRQGLGLRFDETLRFTGGSDTDLFLPAYQTGAVIRWSARPQVYEHLPASRLTFRWQIYRIYRIAANVSHRYNRSSLCRGGPPLWTRLAGYGRQRRGRCPLRIVGGRERFRRKALMKGRRPAKGFYDLAGLTPFRSRPYSRFDVG